MSQSCSTLFSKAFIPELERLQHLPARHLDTDACWEHQEVQSPEIALLIPGDLVFRGHARDDWISLTSARHAGYEMLGGRCRREDTLILGNPPLSSVFL